MDIKGFSSKENAYRYIKKLNMPKRARDRALKDITLKGLSRLPHIDVVVMR